MRKAPPGTAQRSLVGACYADGTSRRRVSRPSGITPVLRFYSPSGASTAAAASRAALASISKSCLECSWMLMTS